jgi:hypothetical protein
MSTKKNPNLVWNMFLTKKFKENNHCDIPNGTTQSYFHLYVS